MRRNTSAILLILGIFLVLIALNFLFFVDTRAVEENEQTGSRSSYRATPYGTLAFYTLLKESGYQVARFEHPYMELEKRSDIGTLVIVAPPERNNPTGEEFESLTRWVESGGLLVIIDRVIHVSFEEASVSTQFTFGQAQARPLQPTVYVRGVNQVALSQFASRVKVEADAFTYHLGDEHGAVLADAVIGEGRVILLTDPYVVANNGIAQADNVALALNLFSRRPPGAIAFDEYHHGYSAAAGDGLMAYFSNTPLPWMLWQGALIAALMVYTYGRRFARPLPLPHERRTTNLEFVSSMANITRLARATDLAMQSIYSEFRNRLCRYSGLPVRAETDRLAARAARRADMDEKELLRLLTRCEQISKGDQASDSELLALVRRIREIESKLNF